MIGNEIHFFNAADIEWHGPLGWLTNVTELDGCWDVDSVPMNIDVWSPNTGKTMGFTRNTTQKMHYPWIEYVPHSIADAELGIRIHVQNT